jgi:hypothetical protein
MEKNLVGKAQRDGGLRYPLKAGAFTTPLSPKVILNIKLELPKASQLFVINETEVCDGIYHRFKG